jgi:NADPH-dependent glutamate synthase beta subunit-like oxidoreductase/dihydroorotate dehydrogenase
VMSQVVSDPRLAVAIAGLSFRNPFFVASGPTTHSADQIARACELGWAGASIKLTFDPPPYINRVPRYGYFEGAGQGFLSFTAERRLAFDEGLELVRQSLPRVSKDFVVMANYSYAGDAGVEGWVNMARGFVDAGCHALEVNLGCPNMSFNRQLTGDYDASDPKSGASVGMVPELTAEIVKATREAVSVPVFVKLTPEGGQLGSVSKAAYEAGADAVGSNANRLAIPPIDIYNPKQSCYHLQQEVSMSCMSGPWAKPLALRDLFEIRKRNGPDVRAVATGGCETWSDAIEFALFGADLIGICTAILAHGFGIIEGLVEGVLRYMDRMGHERWGDMRGLLVNEVKSAPALTLYPGHARCKDPNLSAPCKAACPDQVPAQAYVEKVADRDFEEAFRLITAKSPLQAVCGYICAHPCETSCTRGDVDEPIRIRDIKRFVLEYGAAQGWQPEVDRLPETGKKVAVIGSGPAGIACAWDLARAGHAVTIFEAAKQPGGMLRYGVPSFRLPAAVLDSEIAAVRKLGVKIRTNRRLGKDVTLGGLKAEGFDAVFLGLGCQSGRVLGCPGDDARGVVSAVDFLCNYRRGKKTEVGETVAVIGGGFTAVDAARTAQRLGAEQVFLCYRRTRDEMPAVPDEVYEAEEEGVRVMYLVAPVEVQKKRGKVVGIKMRLHTLGEPDASGRRRPDPVSETEFALPCDMVINALGQVVAEGLEGLSLTCDGTIAADPATGATNLEGVFAGGDAATGTDTVIAAVASGRRAAVSIDIALTGGNPFLGYAPALTEVSKDKVLARTRISQREGRVPLELRAPLSRRTDFETYTPVLTEEEAVKEASRCLGCGCGVGCGLCYQICTHFAVERTGLDQYQMDEEKCLACGMCFRRCPNQNIEMVRLEGTV